MSQRNFVREIGWFGVAICVILAGWPKLAAAENATVASRFLPPSTLVYAELADPVQVYSTILDHPLRQRLEQLLPVEMLKQTEDYRKFQAGVGLAEGLFGMPWREALESITENGIAFAVDLDTKGVALILAARDDHIAQSFVEKVMMIASLEKTADVQQVEYRGVKAFRRDDLRVAACAGHVLITNSSDLGRAVLDRMIDGSGLSLADDDTFSDALKARSNRSNGWGFVHLETIRKRELVPKLFAGQIDNPLVELMVGGIQSALARTPYGSAGVNLDQSGLELHFAVPFEADWIPERREYYFGPGASGTGPALPVIDQELLEISTHRNLAELWMRAGDLFDERINDEFAKADATLTTIFAGRDFGEDILGAINPEIGLIAVRQNYSDQLPQPAIKLPAFALIMTMKDPQKVSRDFRRTFQSVVGFFNVVGAQEGLNQLELDMEKFSDRSQLVISRYVPEQDAADSTHAKIIFNFSPTIGFADERFILSSTTDLARILTKHSDWPTNHPNANVSAEISADVLQQVLADNRAQLVAQNMLEEGHSKEEAESVIGLILDTVGFLSSASARLVHEDKTLKLTFRVGVDAE
ncbi:DUF3352 domain-containing protein [Roseiconus lacunae]|uniref:DUF3352 domain-containing protein n=1 Tax=Roseiconus lacunae TaxID=2605694 RepID=UPI0011F335C1|nr:DUF3352 domain-containing protein [Roseiconus lacunae]